ncbi:MAG TPA: hypothetical protein DIC22_08845 [Chitinophagaceae bacterium]|nr:hypothetical protein [Chitinophagaceae bacterium]
MKPWSLYSLGLLKPRFLLRITSVLIILNTAAAIQAQSLIPELVFKNPVLKTGRGCSAAGRDGAVYIFENVGWGLDALVTILGRSNAAVALSNPDIQGPDQNAKEGTGYDNAWQPGIKYADGKVLAHQTWWMEFKISFVSHARRESFISVNQFFVSGLDIDGDGNQLHEFQAYYKMHSFSLDRQTAIFASTVRGSERDPLLRGKRFDGPTRNYAGISVTAADAMVCNYYTGSSSLIVRLGAVTGTGGSLHADRMYGLLFRSLAFDIPVTKRVPVSLVALNSGSRLNE